MTDNLQRRIHEHNSGTQRTTRPYAPFELVFSEEYPDRIAARKVEKQLKSGFGKEYLRSLIEK
jgi:putative endonuclease